ncbi:MAG: hypothetical protein M5U26_19230 [Planctomycetota bacterium]|nr:hypothetical protein [Planctomycetota bacterium]
MILLLPCVLLLVWGLASWVMTPLRKAAQTPAPPIQFQLTDLYLLLVQLLVWGGLIAGWGAPEEDEAVRRAVLGVSWLLWSGAWWLTVRWLSRAGISSMRRRALVLGLASPLAFVALPLLVGVPFASSRWHSHASHSTPEGRVVVEETDRLVVYGLEFDTPPALKERLVLPLVVAPGLLAFGVFIACRKLVRRALEGRDLGLAGKDAAQASSG